jgi:hypothetical protein
MPICASDSGLIDRQSITSAMVATSASTTALSELQTSAGLESCPLRRCDNLMVPFATGLSAMKSPWKFLAPFIPKRRSAETPDSSIVHHPVTERRHNRIHLRHAQYFLGPDSGQTAPQRSMRRPATFRRAEPQIPRHRSGRRCPLSLLLTDANTR